MCNQAIQLTLCLDKGFFIFGFYGQLDQTINVFGTLLQVYNGFYHLLKGDFFFTEGLSSLRLIPHVGTFEFAVNFF